MYVREAFTRRNRGPPRKVLDTVPCLEKLREAAAVASGEHNFAAFCRPDLKRCQGVSSFHELAKRGRPLGEEAFVAR